ncbi:MAG: CBS domain-containing protein [Vicinamibacterales bacterium]
MRVKEVMSKASAQARKDLMGAGSVRVKPNDTVRVAANLMRGRKVDRLPVVDGDRMVGVVTVADLLGLLGRGIDRPEAAERRGLNHRAPHRKSHVSTNKW